MLWSLAAGGPSTGVYALAKAMGARGVETFAPDIRGHGASGSRGELIYADKFTDAVGPRVPVRLIDGVNQREIVSAPAAVAAIADDVAKAGSGS